LLHLIRTRATQGEDRRRVPDWMALIEEIVPPFGDYPEAEVWHVRCTKGGKKKKEGKKKGRMDSTLGIVVGRNKNSALAKTSQEKSLGRGRGGLHLRKDEKPKSKAVQGSCVADGGERKET